MEVFISYPSGLVQPFRKSIVNNEILHEINEIRVTPDQYQAELYATKLVQRNPNTLFLDSSRVNKVAIMTDADRTGFIEFMCGCKQLITSYQQLEEEINAVKQEMGAAIKDENALINDSKKLKKEKAELKKRQELTKELENETMQSDLFTIYQNNKTLATANSEIEEDTKVLEETKAKVTEVSDALKACAARELTAREEKTRLQLQLDEMGDELITLQESVDEEQFKFQEQENLKTENQKDLEAADQDIEATRRRIQTLKDQNDSNDDSHEEYENLKRSFDSSNNFLLLEHSSLKSIVGADEFDNINKVIDEIFETAKKSGEEIKAIDGEIDKLKEERDVNQSKYFRIKQELSEFEAMEKKHQKLEFELDLMRQKSSTEKLDAKVLEELKRKFYKRVIGRIDQIWTPVKPEDASFIKSRLGRYSKVIVVDNLQTAQECSEYLKLKQLSPNTEVFLPLQETSQQKDSKFFISDDQESRSQLRDVIENLFIAKGDRRRNAMIYILGPAMVMKSLQDAEAALKWSESQKIAVASTETGTFFRPNGLLERSASLLDVEIDENSISEKEKALQENFERLTHKKRKIHSKKSELRTLEYKIHRVSNRIAKLEEELESKNKNELIEVERVKTLKNELQTIAEDDSRRADRERYETLNSELEEKERQHFKGFCKKVGVDSIKLYLKQRSELKTRELREFEVSSLEHELNDLIAFKKNLQRSNIYGFTTSKALIQQLKDKETEMENLTKQCILKEREYLQLDKELRLEQAKESELIQKVSDAYDKVYDKLHRVQECLKENYSKLMDIFLRQSSVDLKAGTLINFVITPADSPDDYDAVREALNK